MTQLTPQQAKSLSKVDLVARVVAEPGNVNQKLAVVHLEGCADPEAARFLVGAFARGDAPPWLTAELLGCIGHDAGYETARAILADNGGREAGCALAKIRGSASFPDLVKLLREAPKPETRSGAAHGLGMLGSVEAANAVLDAAVSGLLLLPMSEVATILGGLPLSHDRVLELLESGQERLIRLGTDVVSSMLDRGQCVIDPPTELVAAVRRVLADPGVTMSPRKRAQLSSWVACP